jgi:hypothetical protein
LREAEYEEIKTVRQETPGGFSRHTFNVKMEALLYNRSNGMVLKKEKSRRPGQALSFPFFVFPVAIVGFVTNRKTLAGCVVGPSLDDRGTQLDLGMKSKLHRTQ